MTRRTIMTMTVAAAALASSGAQAAVRYTFDFPFDVFVNEPISFSYTAPGFITSETHVAPDSCTTPDGAGCEGAFVDFSPNLNVNFGDGEYAVVTYQTDVAFGELEFALGSFGNYGTFTGHSTAFGIDGTLTIEPVAGAVPEPATWAMMIGGFGIVGGAMRRRPRLEVA